MAYRLVAWAWAVMVNDMAKRLDYWLTVSWFKATYNIQLKTLNGRDVMSRVNADGHTEFNLHDAVEICADLISKRLNTSEDQVDQKNDAENRKAFEELRKLRLENAERSGEAVAVADLKEQISSALRAMTDRLSGIPSKVKMGTTDFKPTDMAIVSNMIIQKRNEAAGHKREYD